MPIKLLSHKHVPRPEVGVAVLADVVAVVAVVAVYAFLFFPLLHKR